MRARRGAETSRHPTCRLAALALAGLAGRAPSCSGFSHLSRSSPAPQRALIQAALLPSQIPPGPPSPPWVSSLSGLCTLSLLWTPVRPCLPGQGLCLLGLPPGPWPRLVSLHRLWGSAQAQPPAAGAGPWPEWGVEAWPPDPGPVLPAHGLLRRGLVSPLSPRHILQTQATGSLHGLLIPPPPTPSLLPLPRVLQTTLTFVP